MYVCMYVCKAYLGKSLSLSFIKEPCYSSYDHDAKLSNQY